MTNTNATDHTGKLGIWQHATGTYKVAPNRRGRISGLLRWDTYELRWLPTMSPSISDIDVFPSDWARTDVDPSAS